MWLASSRGIDAPTNSWCSALRLSPALHNRFLETRPNLLVGNCRIHFLLYADVKDLFRFIEFKVEGGNRTRKVTFDDYFPLRCPPVLERTTKGCVIPLDATKNGGRNAAVGRVKLGKFGIGTGGGVSLPSRLRGDFCLYRKAQSQETTAC